MAFTWLLQLFWIYSQLGFYTGEAGRLDAEVIHTCEPIQIDMCKDIGYNLTGMPNLVGSDSQLDAGEQLKTFTSLIQYGCSSQMGFFLCTVYAPMCTVQVPEPIGPCRPMCLTVQRLCEPLLNSFGFPWPAALNCLKFPQENDDAHMCMEGPGERWKAGEGPGRTPDSRLNEVIQDQPEAGSRDDQWEMRLCQAWRHPHLYAYINHTQKCALKCSMNDIYTQEDKRFAEIWMGIWSGVCFVSTVFTLLTFLIDSQRFRYPERPLLALSLCYNLVSIGFLVRLFAGADAVSCYMESHSGRTLYVTGGLQNTNCTIVFLLLYYFGMAASLWWVVLAFTWFLTSGRKWSHEAIQRHSGYFHLVTWAVPAGLTVVILVMRTVDADELTGLCYVGIHSGTSLLWFVIIPLAGCLFLGIIFLMCGFISLFRVRQHVREHGGEETDKLDKLMVRIGVLSLLYTLTATCVLATTFYQYYNQESWHNRRQPKDPNLEILMLKLLMTLLPGTASGMWVWSPKTLVSWKIFLCGICRCKKYTKRRTDNSQQSVRLNMASPYSPQSSTTINSKRFMKLSNETVL